MKKIISGFLIISFVVLIPLAGCGSDVSTSESSDSVSEDVQVSSEAEETEMFSEGIADDYAQYTFMMDTDAVIEDYHERGYNYVWLESHEVEAPDDGVIGDAGTIDLIDIVVARVGEDDTYYVTEGIRVLYIYWGANGWNNNLQEGELIDSDFSGFNDTYWKYVSYADTEIGKAELKDVGMAYVLAILGEEILGEDMDYAVLEDYDSIEVYFHLENFDDLSGEIDDATSFTTVEFNYNTEDMTYGTVMLIVDGDVYIRELKKACGYVYIGETISETVRLTFKGDDIEDEIAAAYFEYADETDRTSSATISQISEAEYMSASEGGSIVVSDNADNTDNVDDVDNADNTDQDYIFPNSNSSYLTESDLENLTAEELRIARNEIYARHGRIFSDESLNEYFNSTTWYTGTVSPDEFDDSVLNEYEKANAALISEYESEMGY
ncbi:MAG: YARHG domain-containing protein [Clostridiales bacterium]|nr:YARHG domain-containing protein [Clostridiales bacterium]